MPRLRDRAASWESSDHQVLLARSNCPRSLDGITPTCKAWLSGKGVGLLTIGCHLIGPYNHPVVKRPVPPADERWILIRSTSIINDLCQPIWVQIDRSTVLSSANVRGCRHQVLAAFIGPGLTRPKPRGLRG
jgi:hypothetical protein